MGSITQLTQNEFDEQVRQDTPILVDFWAEWCAPCRAIAPILEELAGEQDGRLRIGKLNVDEQPDIPRQLGIMSIPTLILFSKGEEKARIVGARAKEQLLKEIEPHLA
jgi:thioredoxin 1